MRNFNDIEREESGGKVKKGKIITGLVIVMLLTAGIIAGAYQFGLFGGDGPPSVSVPETLPQGSTVSPGTNGGTDVVVNPVELERSEGVYTFLAYGVDESGYNTDVIMLVVYDTANGKVNILNIPRDTYSNANDRRESLKHINLAYAYKGLDQLKYEVMNLVGYNVDWCVKINMDGFVKLINYIGGVDFYVPQNMKYDDDSQNLHINLKKGQQTLSGAQALQLVRFRSYFNADIGRINVRSDFLKAMAEQLISSQNAVKAAELAGVVFDNVTTDVSKDDLVWFAKKAVTLNSSNINFYVVPGGPATDSGMWIPYKNELLTMINDYFNPFNSDITNINIVSRSENQGK